MVITGPAIEGPVEDASKAYARGEYETAYRLFKPLEEQGLSGAQYKFAGMYDLGLGVPQDYVRAHLWFNLATSRFPASEQEKQEMAVNHRDRVSSNMTPDQIAEAQRLVREWKPKKELK